MQGIICADAHRTHAGSEYARYAVRFADQAVGRTGQRGGTDIIGCQLTNALALDHLRSELAFHERIREDGRFHDRVPTIQVIPGIGLCNAYLLRLADSIFLRVTLL